MTFSKREATRRQAITAAASIVRSHSRGNAVGAFPGGDVEKGLAESEKQGNVMIDDLLWWAAALKSARER